MARAPTAAMEAAAFLKNRHAWEDAIRFGRTSVYFGAWQIGRIYGRRGFPDAVRWSWSLHGVVLTRPPSIQTDGFAPTLEEAKVQFQKSWHARRGRGWKRCRKLRRYRTVRI
jgi:hypothetical protein